LFVRNEDVIIGAGLSANLREGNITIQSGNKSSEYPSLGVEPLVNFYGLWSPVNNWMILVEGDLLITGSRRTEDIFAGMGYRFSDMFVLKGGYRLVEGGTETDKHYHFTLVNYLALGILISL
jgi:hypothetical protein